MRDRGLALVSLVSVLAMIVATGWWRPATATDDAPGCEGLSDYAAQMMPLAPGQNSLINDRDPLTISSAEWDEIAEAAIAYRAKLSLIDPPAWAAEWHQVRLEWVGLIEQLARAVSKGGVFMVLGFADSIDALDAREQTARAKAIQACPDFARFLGRWNPQDATPAATPVVVPTTTPRPTRTPQPTPTVTPHPTETPTVLATSTHTTVPTTRREPTATQPAVIPRSGG